jgi:glycosyltransferase involved in cell wall biosynthesis
MTELRFCALVPTYDNAETLRGVVVALREHLPDVFVVNDGSGQACREVCEALAREGLAVVVHRTENGGKGAAVKSGFRAALEHGFTHALQVDADGQHDLSRVPAFLEAARRSPTSAVFAYPEYDATAPKGRLAARKITTFWVNLEVGGKGIIEDAMVGFRVYPLRAASDLAVRSNRMDFDVEIAVRLAWAGVPIVNLPVGVRYLTAAEGGRSHFQPFRDNVRISLLHCRLCTLGCTLWCMRKVGLVPRLGAS